MAKIRFVGIGEKRKSQFWNFLTIPIRRKYLQISGVIENKSMFVQCIFFGAAAPGGHQGLRKEGALPGSKRTFWNLAIRDINWQNFGGVFFCWNLAIRDLNWQDFGGDFSNNP